MDKLNLGFDFGSTYSLLAVLDNDNGGLGCLNITCGSPYIPSKVAYDGSMNRYSIGNAAQSHIGEEDYRVYSTFKTLLNSSADDPLLAERGYDSENTPTLISGIFIEKLLKKVMDNYNVSEIENLVVGIPENWGKSFKFSHARKSVSQAIGKQAIEKILNGFDFIRNTTIITEPEAASAFFAYNYNKNQKEPLDGQVLIIDYGGGTLDITLSQITSIGNEGKMQIKVLDSDGEGENYGGNVGNAGIRYMEELIRCAMKEAGIQAGSYKGGFEKLVSVLEEKLRSGSEEVKEIFEEFVPENPLSLEQLKKFNFVKNLEYKQDGQIQTFSITYEQMYRVYREVIYPTLDRLIDRMIIGVDTNSDQFKIGLVGGFSNFYLVRKQVEDKFKITSSGDKRTAGLLTNPEDREKAISLGAALIANQVISLCQTTEYAMGVYAKVNGRILYNYGIKYRQEIEYDKVYFASDSKGNEYIVRSVNGSLDKLLIKIGMDDKDAFYMRPKEGIRRRMQNIITNNTRTAYIGFSIGSDGIISIHVYECDPITKERTQHPKVIRLSDFDNMFDPTIIDTVTG